MLEDQIQSRQLKHEVLFEGLHFICPRIDRGLAHPIRVSPYLLALVDGAGLEYGLDLRYDLADPRVILSGVQIVLVSHHHEVFLPYVELEL